MVSQSRNFHNPEFKQKKRKRFIRRIILSCTLVIVVIGGLAALTHWSKVIIVRTNVVGTVVLNPNDIRTAARQIMSGDDALIFAKNNALLYPRGKMMRELPVQFPRIQSLSVGLSDWHTLQISVSERQPFALWCDNPPNIATTPEDDTSSSTSTMAGSSISNCYFLDQSGFVFAHAPDFSGDAYFKYYGLLPYASPVGSDYLASSTVFSQLSDFVNTVKELNITPLYIVATDQDDFDMYVYGGGQIIFDDKTPLTDTAHNLQVLLQTPNLIPQQNGELMVDYIDLRFGDKLYYKLRP